MRNKAEFNISERDRQVVGSVVHKIRSTHGTKDNKLALMSFDGFYDVLNDDEFSFVRRFPAINPRDYGFHGPFLGAASLPRDLIAIRNQRYIVDLPRGQEERTIDTQYLPKRVYQAYGNLNHQIASDLGKRVLVDSGYRSPACQLFTLLDYLQKFEFDLPKTFSLVAFPGYSEHGFPPKQAIDFATETGIGESGVDERFALTEEYSWLLKNSSKFGFKLSYPQGNSDGIDFEPWHWSYADQ